MSAKAPAFQFYAKDFLEGTAAFSNAEVGAYLRLLLHSWDAGPLPTDEMRLARLAKESRAEFRKLWIVISVKWKREGDGLINVRLESVRETQRAYRSTMSTRGKRGAKVRWQPPSPSNGTSNGTSNAQAMPTPMRGDSSPVSSLQSPRSPVTGTGDLGHAKPKSVGNHAGNLSGRHQLCPEGTSQACARGKCVPRSLFAEWSAQLGGSSIAAYDYIREFVGRVLASLPAGPIAEDGYDFWRGHWRAQHPPTVPAKGGGTGKGDQSKSAMQRALGRFKGES